MEGILFDDRLKEVTYTKRESPTFGSIFGNLKYTTRDREITSGYLRKPVLKQTTRIQLALKSNAFILQFLPLRVHVPSFSENVLDTFNVDHQLIVNLTGPDDKTGKRRNIFVGSYYR